MTTRRGFLGMLSIGLAAPAIVKAESLMRIVVPKRGIILLPEEPVRDFMNVWTTGQDIHIQAVLLATIREQVYQMYANSSLNRVNHPRTQQQLRQAVNLRAGVA